MADILLLPVFENKRRHIKILLPVSILSFDFTAVVSIWFCTGLPNYMQIG